MTNWSRLGGANDEDRLIARLPSDEDARSAASPDAKRSTPPNAASNTAPNPYERPPTLLSSTVRGSTMRIGDRPLRSFRDGATFDTAPTVQAGAMVELAFTFSIEVQHDASIRSVVAETGPLPVGDRRIGRHAVPFSYIVHAIRPRGPIGRVGPPFRLRNAPIPRGLDEAENSPASPYRPTRVGPKGITWSEEWKRTRLPAEPGRYQFEIVVADRATIGRDRRTLTRVVDSYPVVVE